MALKTIGPGVDSQEINDNFAYLDDAKSNKNADVNTYSFGGAVGTNTTHIAQKLDIPTYDGSGQAVHPDVLNIPGGFGADKWEYWMAFTPYPNTNDRLENPSILASHDGINWETPGALVNPVIPAPANTADYNSDPDLVFYNNQLYLFYRETKESVTPVEQRIYLVTSNNGEDWGVPTEVLFGTGATDGLMSPAAIYDSGFKLWIVDGWGNLTKRTSTDGITWTDPVDCTTTGMPIGRDYWHINVVKNGNRLDMLLTSSTGAGGADARMQYAYSYDDGLTWTTGDPVIQQTYNFESALQYRGSMVQRDTYLYDVYYSAQSSDGTWSIALMRAVVLNDQFIPLYPSDYRNHIEKTDYRGKSAWILLSAINTIPNATTTAIDWGNVVHDDMGFFDSAKPARLTIPEHVEKVRIVAGVNWANNTAGDRRLYISKNGKLGGLDIVASSVNPAGATSADTITSPVLSNLKAGDYFQIYVYQDSGAGLDITTVNSSFVSIEVIE